MLVLPRRLNERTLSLLNARRSHAAEARIEISQVADGGEIWDCGVQATGSLAAGHLLAEACLAGLGEVTLGARHYSDWQWPTLQVTSDDPLAACLLSQYAGWQMSVGKYFAMGSGPMRAAAAREEIFAETGYKEQPTACVGILEGRTLPTAEVYAWLAERTGVAPEQITLLIAPTASLAGSYQVVARVVETALHKLHALKFDLSRIISATGTAPLAPVAKNDLAGIGRTNDAILYGGSVHIWVRGDDASLTAIGPQVPAQASPSYGAPFLKIFEAAGRDFYKIDPLLFSPGEITFQNIDTGRVQRFGRIAPDVLRESFGLE